MYFKEYFVYRYSYNDSYVLGCSKKSSGRKAQDSQNNLKIQIKKWLLSSQRASS